MAGWRFRGVLVLAAVLLFAGCTSTPGLSESSRPPAPSPTTTSRPPAGSSAELGELSTVDPCSLTRPESLYRFGHAALGRPVSLDYCVTTVDTQGGAHIEVSTGELSTVDPASQLAGKSLVPLNGMQLVRNQLEQGECTRPLIFTDHIALDTRVDLFAGDTSVDLCEVAETAAKSAAELIAHGQVGHRQFAPNSLGRMDPCGQVPPAALNAVPGLAGATPIPSPGRHQCTWGSDEPGKLRLRLLYGAGDPPQPQGDGAAQERIAGRSTVITPVGGGGPTALCTAETAHIPYGSPDAHSVELATVVVVMPGASPDRACSSGRAVAASVWPQLPHA